MEDCLHTSSENLSKLVSWAHSHGTICSLIPNLKHLLSEGSHGNLTAMWGCSAGHAYHWPLTATCRAGSQERVCFQDNRSFNSDSPSIIGIPSETQTSPLDRYPGRSGKGKLDCNRTRDSCDFSYCSEPSEMDETVEEYEDENTLFDMVCESSVTDEDSDFEHHAQRSPNISRKRAGTGSSSALPGSQSQVIDESSSDVIVKKIKQEIPEDYYIVANAELTGGVDGPALSLTQMSKPKPHTPVGPSYVGTSKPTTLIAASLGVERELQSVSASSPVAPRTAVPKPVRTSLTPPNRGSASTSGASQQIALQMPVSTSASTTSQPISIPLSALQLPGQEEQVALSEELLPSKQAASCEAARSPSISTEPEVSSSEQQSIVVSNLSNEATAQTLPDQDEAAAELNREQNEKTIRSTQTALRNFREFLIAKYPSEAREIYVIPCKELDAYLASFFVDARQKDGSEYEPNSLANYQCGLERYLKEHRYGYSITRDKEFKRSQEALKQKQIELRCKGKGNKPHKSMKLTFADELILRKRGLLSRYNPEGLLNLVWLNNTKAFGHCTGFHGSTLKWGDVRLRVLETGLEYLEWMGQESPDAKTKRAGTECRVYATPHAPQTCPVQDYKEYAQRRPPAMRYEDAPFYLSIKPVVNLAALHWYNCQALGKNKLAKMVKTMCEKGNIPAYSTKLNKFPVFNFNDELKNLCISAVSPNTTKATLYALNVWRYWCMTKGLKEYMDFTKISAVKLNELLEDFYVTVKKTDGSDFLATSLHAIRRGLDRILKNAGAGFSITSSIFSSSSQKLKEKLRVLNKAGMSGARSRVIVYFSLSDEEEMWRSGCLGDESPVALLSTVVKYNSQYLNMRTLQEHADLMFGDIELLKDAQNRPFFARTDSVKREGRVNSSKVCYGQIYHEHSKGHKRCPYCLLYKYMYAHRPPTQVDAKSPFYLTARKEITGLDSVWYEEQRMGLRSLRGVVPKLAKKVKLEHCESYTFVSFTQAYRKFGPLNSYQLV
uniref:Uncharacterized protein KIAA1958 homolog isoform X1 n=1 Tax=Geotrypetes seraphini TaxID=260995 RepID=A0A6P8PK46_GEOSA|nr:uncharacterized protein KIAA1958 homolog isoform X1 [Geotrypetes seraphini]XP_033781914.1 uncharacterized protein KIAA1958 homolog isoform X1 [Geotrypetes seraphini]XP_033781925.1 uncharacterized protein KIAA1958 homolog isoform X1 [Geotrypetes seraphini]